MLNKNLVVSNNTKMGVQRERRKVRLRSLTEQRPEAPGHMAGSRRAVCSGKTAGGGEELIIEFRAGERQEESQGALCQGGVGVFLSGRG